MNKVYIISNEGKQYELGDLKELTEADVDKCIDEAVMDSYWNKPIEVALQMDYVEAFKLRLAFMGKEYWRGKVPQRIFAKSH